MTPPTPAHPAAPPEIRLVGVPRLRNAGGDWVELKRGHAALLALLALDAPLPRARAIELLWPDAPAAAAGNRLRQRIFQIKELALARVVEPDGALQFAPGVVCDVGAEPAPDADDLLAGIDGEAVGSEFADWLAAARRRHDARRRAAAAAALAAFERDGAWDDALALVERLLERDPSAEPLHRQRMRLHHLRGDRAAVRRAWAACVAALREHAGAAPDAATRALASLADDDEPALADPAGGERDELALRRPPLRVGREREWQRLVQGWREGRSVLVVGEPGIGKSRLLEDFAAVNGLLERKVGSRFGEATQPYALAARILRDACRTTGVEPWARAELAHLCPEWGSTEGPLQPLRLRQAWLHALREAAADGLAALVVDDLQFADAASLELLLAAAEAATPPLVTAVRAAEVPGALADWLAAQDAGSIVELRLEPLGEGAVDALLRSLSRPPPPDAAARERLARRSGGNPLFLLVLLQAGRGVADADASLRQLLARRFERLSPPAQRLARLAALAGPDFDIARAAEVLGQHVVDLVEPLAELERAGWMREGRFAYDLAAEAAAASVPEAIARVLHAELARVLARHGGDPGRIAAHCERAGRWADAADHHAQAAERARRQARRREELDHLDDAAACLTRLADREGAFRVGVQAVDAALACEAAAAVDARTVALLVAAPDDDGRLDALLARARYRLSHADDGEPTAAVCDDALALARRLGDARRALRAASLGGVSRVLAGRAEEALAVFDAAAADLAAVDDSRAEEEFRSNHGYALATAGRHADAVAAYRAAAEAALRHGDLQAAMVTRVNLSASLGQLGRYDEGLEAIDDALALWTRQGEPPGIGAAANWMNAGMLRVKTGRLGRALPDFERALALVRGTGAAMWEATIALHLAMLLLRLGQPARALQALPALAAELPLAAHVRGRVVGARIDAALGRPAGTASLRATLRELTDAGTPQQRLDLRIALAATLPADEALAECDALLQAAADGEPVLATGVAAAHAWRADALRRLGRAAEAADAADRAGARRDERPAVFEMTPAEFWWIACQAYAAAGRDADAARACRNGLAAVAEGEVGLPPEMVEAYRDRQPAHRGLLTARARAAALR